MTTTRRALDVAARAVLADRTEAILRRLGAVDDRHVALEDGRHSGLRVDAIRACLDPAATGELCGFWARLHRDRAGSPTVDAVVGSSGAGILLAWETARQLGVRAGLVPDAGGPTEEDVSEGLRPIGIVEGDRVVVVDAVLDRTRLQAMVEAVERIGCEVVGCAVLTAGIAERPVVASPGSGRRYELLALWRTDPGPFEAGPTTCPACAIGRSLAAGVPIAEAGPAAARDLRRGEADRGRGAS